MTMFPDSRTILHKALNHWVEIATEWHGPDFVQYCRDLAEPHLGEFLKDHSHMTAEELEEVAGKLSPGGVHDGGLLVNIVWAGPLWADPLLVAAIMWWNWHGGKVGFQFLSNPRDVDPDEYREEVCDLLSLFDEATEGDSRRLLTGDDLAFFDNLPDRFTIYRGCNGLSPEQAGAGVCWTTKREIADWFAGRGNAEPVVVTARISKDWVRLAKSSEFEIVTIPMRSRPIKWRQSRLSGNCPEMCWARSVEENFE